MIDFISFIENQYQCSGFCSPSLFYLTQSIEKGAPKSGCLAPFVGDMVGYVGNLGEAMVASAVIFFLMIFFVFPVCCYKSLDMDGVKPFGNEGGQADGIEMN